ncbi:MAG: AIR synthase-related protein, partial [Pseudomonadota bacterium]
LITAAHDLSDGGLAVAAAEMALAAGLGVELSAREDMAPNAWFFGEDQGPYLIAISPENLARVTELAIATQLSIRRVGHVGGSYVTLGSSRVPLTELSAAHGGGFAKLMGEGGE